MTVTLRTTGRPSEGKSEPIPNNPSFSCTRSRLAPAVGTFGVDTVTPVPIGKTDSSREQEGVFDERLNVFDEWIMMVVSGAGLPFVVRR